MENQDFIITNLSTVRQGKALIHELPMRFSDEEFIAKLPPTKPVSNRKLDQKNSDGQATK